MTVAILPAAGESSRMGKPKLLLPFADTTVVGALIASLRGGGVGRIVVVVAPGDDELRSWAARDRDLAVTENPRPEGGMLSSILCGLAALGGGAGLAAAGEVVLVTPADLPAIRPDTIRRLVEALRGASTPLAVPVYSGKRGHPLAIGAGALREAAALDPAVGLRQLLDRLAVLELAVDDPGVVEDVDTPADYDRLRAAAERCRSR